MPAQTEFRGTALRQEDIDKGRVLTHTSRPLLKYRWAAGVAIGRFLDGMKEGRIVASRCGRCERTVVPPRSFCEMCFVPVSQYVDLPQTGVVNTFVLTWIATDRSRLEKPLVPAVVDIDGTTGAGLLHLIGNVDPKKVKIGMRVRAVWRPEKERKGDITDLLHWAPVGGGKK